MILREGLYIPFPVWRILRITSSRTSEIPLIKLDIQLPLHTLGRSSRRDCMGLRGDGARLDPSAQLITTVRSCAIVSTRLASVSLGLGTLPCGGHTALLTAGL